MTNFKIALLFLLFVSSTLIAQNTLTRYPSVDPAGENIAFSYQGDIWVMNLESNVHQRLTIHEAYDSQPIWSPDGKMIAFSSKRYGSTDVFVMNNDGSGLKRLTYHPSTDKVNSWNSPDRIVFETRRINAQIERDNELFYVSPNGGNPQKLMDALGSYAVESPNGKYIAFVRGSCRITRQAYQGSANKDIWLYDKEDKTYTQLTTEIYNQFQPQWKSDHELLFISSNGGKVYQLNAADLTAQKTLENKKTLTQYDDFGLRYFSISAKTGKVIMESGDHIFTLQNNKATPLSININREPRKNNFEHKTYTGDVRSYSVSPNGKYLATSIHGDIFITQAKTKDNFTKALTNDVFNNRNPEWLNDTTLLFISDKEGQKDIYLIKSAKENESDIFKSLKHEVKNMTNSKEDENKFSISNKGDKIAFVKSQGILLTANISAEGKISGETELKNSWADPGSISWSPDDQFLAYSMTNLDFNSEIYIQAADNSQAAVNVSMHPRKDLSPCWSPDGSKLLFSSIRNYGNYDIWYVWLQKKDWEKTMTEWKLEEEPKSKKDDKKKKKKEIKVKIDFENIHERLYQLTSLPGNETAAVFSTDGKTIYFNSNSNEKGKTDLYKINWDKKDIKALTKDGKTGGGLELSPDGKYIYMVKKGGKPARLKMATDKMENIAIKAQTDINHKALREHVYTEAWGVINDGFYDPNFHGVDWQALGDKYKPVALKSSTEKDFIDVFNWLLGEINASHMGMSAPRSKKKATDKTALLGIDFDQVDNGVKITKTLTESPADKEESQILIGDIITHIDGVILRKEQNFYQLLANKTNEPVILNVNRNGEVKEIIIRPTASLNSQKYKDWVAFNTKLVDEYSGGKLGYLHIKSMGWPSFEKFERDIMAAGYGKEGILIDVRYNGGGWTTDYLMAVLTVKQHAYTVPRGATDNLEKNHLQFREHYAFGERLPFASWTKPSIALCNQNSYSNAEIFSHAYKSNELGTLVGTPTFGAVISTSGRTLSNGGFIRLPFRAWYAKDTDKNMEIDPAVPDVLIDILPDSRARGKDEQLKKAVEILLNQIK